MLCMQKDCLALQPFFFMYPSLMHKYRTGRTVHRPLCGVNFAGLSSDNCFKGSVGETSERWGGVHRVFRVHRDTILNWSELGNELTCCCRWRWCSCLLQDYAPGPGATSWQWGRLWVRHVGPSHLPGKVVSIRGQEDGYRRGEQTMLLGWHTARCSVFCFLRVSD